MELILFVLLAATALVGAVLTIAWKNPLRGAFSLLVCLFALAGIYVTLYAHFLAAMQLLVYAGAIMVLFVFVIMLLNLSPDEMGERKVSILGVLSGLAALLVFGKFAKVLWTWQPGIQSTGAPFGDDFGSIGAVAQLLFRQFLMPFELASILLLVAVVGAVVIARRRFWR